MTASIVVIGFAVEKYNTTWIGATVGGVWGLFSFFIWVAGLRGPFFIGVILGLPFYITIWLTDKTFSLFGEFLSTIVFFISPILIGVFIGSIIGYAIEKYKQPRSSN